MHLFETMGAEGHEQVAFWSEPSIGYKGIIAIHDTTLGPGLGGTRFFNYKSEDEAIWDVLRLSQGMTYKSSVAGLNLGGAKSVIIGDPRTRNREMIFRAHGRAIEALGGRYITAEDSGTSVDDMEFVRMETSSVVGLYGGSGDPSPVTAYGVYMGMRACATERYGDPSLREKRVTVQGVGHVGYYLCERLHEEGAELVVTDVDEDRIQRVVEDFGARAVRQDEIYDEKADIFAPCALGAIINDETIDRLQVDIVAGAANNQLAEDAHGDGLHERDILYAPDYVINAGGIINVYGEIREWSQDRSLRKAEGIHDTLLRIFERAREEGVTPAHAADHVAEQRIDEARQLQRSWLR